jgi:hypothetical protein
MVKFKILMKYNKIKIIYSLNIYNFYKIKIPKNKLTCRNYQIKIKLKKNIFLQNIEIHAMKTFKNY